MEAIGVSLSMYSHFEPLNTLQDRDHTSIRLMILESSTVLFVL
jgi:hypothetical protein